MILRECTYGIARFDSFQERLEVGRNILTVRLNRMVDQGLLERRAYQNHPPRYEYRLTDKGHDATLILAAMMRFGNRWSFKGERAPIVLRDRRTGRTVDPVVVDRKTGKPIDPRAVRPVAGPGFPGSVEDKRAWFSADETDP